MGDDVGLARQNGFDHAGRRLVGGGEHRRHLRVAFDHGLDVALVGDRPLEAVGLGTFAGLEVPGEGFSWDGVLCEAPRNTVKNCTSLDQFEVLGGFTRVPRGRRSVSPLINGRAGSKMERNKKIKGE